jgi:hypothetical protein
MRLCETKLKSNGDTSYISTRFLCHYMMTLTVEEVVAQLLTKLSTLYGTPTFLYLLFPASTQSPYFAVNHSNIIIYCPYLCLPNLLNLYLVHNSLQFHAGLAVLNKE